jgi:hypothetical protein
VLDVQATMLAQNLFDRCSLVGGGAIVTTCAVTICFCRPAKTALPSLIVIPKVAGEKSSARSIVATSYSVGVPGTTSATSLNVQFIPTAYATPQLCMLSKIAGMPEFESETYTTSRLIRVCIRMDRGPIGMLEKIIEDLDNGRMMGEDHVRVRKFCSEQDFRHFRKGRSMSRQQGQRSACSERLNIRMNRSRL